MDVRGSGSAANIRRWSKKGGKWWLVSVALGNPSLLSCRIGEEGFAFCFLSQFA